MAGTAGFLTSLVINFAVAFIVLLLFIIFRKRKPIIYEPRCFMIDNGPVSPGRKCFDWLWAVLGTSDDEFFEKAGMDALTYTLYFRYGFKVFLACAPFGLIILIPVNATATGGLSELDAISLSNVPNSSYAMFAHLTMTYIFSFIGLFFLRNTYLLWISYRVKYFTAASAHHRTILVRDIPPTVCTSAALKTKFGSMYEDVVSSNLPLDVDELKETLAERDKVVRQLEHTTAAFELSEKHKRPTIRDGGLICVGGTVEDAQEFLTKKLADLNQKVAQQKKEALDKKTNFDNGFVTFRSVSSAYNAAQVLHSGHPAMLTTQCAPESRDVCWDNLKLGFRQRYIRSIVVTIVTLALVALWAIPVTFVASLTTLEALSSNPGFSWIGDVVSVSSVLKGFLEGFLPTLALLIFMAILPMICTALTKAEGVAAYSWISYGAFKKLFLFFVVNVFFVSLIAGSIFDSISDFTSFSGGLTLLGNSIPRTGTFFTLYVMIMALSAYPMQLFRVGPLIVSKIKQKFLAKTRREHEEAVAPGNFDYGTALPVQVLVAMLGFVYSCISPIIIPFLCLFFGFGYITYRYLTMYVFIPTYEGGGLFFPILFNRIMTSIFLFQLVLFAVLLIKEFFLSALILPLLPVTILFWRFCNSTYEPAGMFLPRENALQVQPSQSTDSFVQPELVASENVEPEPFTGRVDPYEGKERPLSARPSTYADVDRLVDKD